MNNKVRQSGIKVEGDNAGRDVNKTTHIHHNSVPSGPTLLLAALYKQYQAEKNTKTHTDEFIDDILDYYISDDKKILRDLERKLTDARRKDLLFKAKIYKHNFRQKLERFKLFPSAQKIYSLLLGQALTKFDTYVEPYLSDDLNSADLKVMIQEKIVDQILSSIPGSEPTVDGPTIHGMIYFLTGNCFIDWKQP